MSAVIAELLPHVLNNVVPVCGPAEEVPLHGHDVRGDLVQRRTEWEPAP